MEYYIRIFSNSSSVQKYKLEQGETLVGRSRSAGIRVKDADVSGKHFILRLEGDELSVENLSSNGTLLDDQMLFENSKVLSGQHIRAGEGLDCIIEDEALTAENDIRFQEGRADGKSETNNNTPAVHPTHGIEADKGTAAGTKQGTSPGTREDGTHQGTSPGTSPGTRDENASHGTRDENASHGTRDENASHGTRDENASHGTRDENASHGTNPGTRDETNGGTGHGSVPGTNPGDNTGSHDGTNTGTGDDTSKSSRSYSHSTDMSGTGRGDTVANNTRIATPDEIKYIKEQKQNRLKRHRVIRMFLLLIVALLLVCVCLWKSEPEVVRYEWPKLPNGQYSTDSLSFPGLEVENNGFVVYFPKFDDTMSAVIDNRIVVNTYLGHVERVPLDIVMEYNTDPVHLERTLQEDMLAWIRSHGDVESERWTFEKVSMPQFMGSDNGLPSLAVPYVRELDNRSKYGLARMFRNADTTYVITIEVPLEFREKTERIIDKTAFMDVTDTYVLRHWEGGVKACDLEWNELRLLRKRISTASASRLADLNLVIYGALVHFKKNGDTEKYDFVMELLEHLRQSQVTCYNLMKIRYINALLEKDKKACRRIREESAAFFTCQDDRRYYDILQEW